MKDSVSWHKGRLGKESNAEKLIEMHKNGMSFNAEMQKLEEERDRKKSSGTVMDDKDMSVEDKARNALQREAAAAEGAEESGTLGLTIETGSKSTRNISDADAIKEDLKHCGEETKIDDYEDMPIAEFGMALMRGEQRPFPNPEQHSGQLPRTPHACRLNP